MLSISFTVACVAACEPTLRSSTPDQLQPPAQVSSSAASDPAAGTRLCGIPPCDRYVSRGGTRSLDVAITKHPIASAVAMHLVVGLLCGAILCDWGEGVSLAYVQHEAHLADENGECLRVHILPKGREWQLVRLDATNQSPYCVD